MPRDIKDITQTDPLSTGEYALLYADRTVVSLTANQASGVDPVLLANSNRRGLKMQPLIDCTYWIATGATTGFLLVGGYENTLKGQECPANDIFVRGLTAGTPLLILEA